MERSTVTRKSSVDKKPFKTIVVVDIHNEILNKDILHAHFAKFGRIVKMNLSLKNKNAVISYSKPSEAREAKENGTEIEPNIPPVRIFFSDKGADGTRSRTSLPSASLSRASKTPKSPITLKPTGAPVPLFQALISQPPVQSHQIKSSPVKLKTGGSSSGGGGSSNSSSSNVDVKPFRLPPSILPNKQTDQHSFYPDSTEAQELFARRAVTADEKYRLLEARDKLIRSKNPKVKMRVEFAVKLAGTCPDMCPEKERYMREVQRQLNIYEMKPGKDAEVDHRLAIKCYSRSSADQEEPLPHELRPSATLEMSLAYILHNIIPLMDKGEDLSNWYNFVWDRTRSIRKDITQQQLTDLSAVTMMEKCARFHIHCSSRLCELDRHAFDMKLNDENLMKCLQSLEHMYTDLNLLGKSCPNEPEFRSYQILMNLNEGDILWEIQQKPDWVRESPQVQFAIKVHMAVFEKNYAHFFKLVRTAPYLTACILHRYFFQVRSTALRTIFKAYSFKNKDSFTSLSAVSRVLGFSEHRRELFQYFCSAHGVDCDFDKDQILLSRKTFEMPDSPSCSREYYLIESKLKEPINVILNGGRLDKNPYPDHCPRTSFDEQGYLIPGPLIGVPESQMSINKLLKPQSQTMTDSSLPPSFLSTAKPEQQKLTSFHWPAARESASIPVKPAFGGEPATTSTHTVFGQSPGLFTLPSIPSTTTAPSTSSASPTLGFSFLQQLNQPAPTVKPSPSIFGGGSSTSVTNTPLIPSENLFSSGFNSPASSVFSLPNSGSSRGSLNIFGSTIEQQKQTIGSRLTTTAINTQREMKISKSSLLYCDRIINSEVQKVATACWKKAELQRRIKIQQRQLEVDRKAATICSKLEDITIKEMIRSTVITVHTRQRSVLQKSQESGKRLLEETVRKGIEKICHQCFTQAKREHEHKIRRLGEIRTRIQLRSCVSKWKRFLNKVKMERQIVAEKKLKELENFPSYQNTVLSSPEDILFSWCGMQESGSSRVSTRKSLSPLQNRSVAPDISSCRRRLPLSPSKVQAKDEIDVNALEEPLQRKLVEYYYFPAYTNTGNSSASSILSSWCGGLSNYNYNTNINIIVPSSSSTSAPSESESQDYKKRRLDQDQ